MLAKYYEYNYTNPIIELFISNMNDLNYRYYASELLNQLAQVDEFNFERSVRRAIAILRLTGVPVQRHFSCIYRSAPHETRRDWKISELGCSLVIMSSEPASKEIREMQFALMNYLGL